MIRLTKFDNGLTVASGYFPSFRSVAAGFWVGAGSAFESDAENGISHFTEHVMYKGTKSMTAAQIAERFEDNGANFNAFTSKEATCYYFKCIDENAEKCFALLSHILFESVYDDAELDKERKVIAEEINMVEDSLLLVKHQGDRSGARELWSPVSGMKDSIGNSFPKLPHRMGKNYYTIFDDYHISASGNRFVFAYSMIDRLEMGEARDGRICLAAAVGAEGTPEFHLYGDDTATEFSIDLNIVTYENVYAGRDCVYALYSGQRLDDTEMYHSSLIEVYSWDGEPLRLLSLDVPVASFAVDEDNGVIYAVNPELHEDKILRFRF